MMSTELERRREDGKTESQHLRAEGNIFYKKFQQSLDFSEQKNFLQQANNYYHKSFQSCSKDNLDDLSSAAKNLGTASWKLADIHSYLEARSTLIEYFYREGILYLSTALLYGTKCKDRKWINDVEESFATCRCSAVEQVEDWPYLEKARALEKHISVMVEDSQKSECFIELARAAYNAGLEALDKKDFKTALSVFHDCYRPIEECIRYSPGNEFFTAESRILRNDVIYSLAIAEALQAIHTGEF